MRLDKVHLFFYNTQIKATKNQKFYNKILNPYLIIE